MSDLAKLVEYLTTVPSNPHFQSDSLMIAGNSLPHLIIATADFCENTPTINHVVFIGGIGHGTQPLIDNCQKFFPELVRPAWKQLSEAEIMQEIFRTRCRRELTYHLETRSTNTGENARFSYNLFKPNPPTSFWLVQDPLMQKRTHVTFSQEWKLPLSNIQPLFFERPCLIDFDKRPHFKQAVMDHWWQPDYFLSLVIGEIRRLHDDEQGYGPKGANFIPHVEVPQDVLTCYRQCQNYLVENNRI